MKQQIKVGFIGMGNRGSLMLQYSVELMEGVDVTIISDNFSERLEKNAGAMLRNTEKNMHIPYGQSMEKKPGLPDMRV